VVSTNDPTRAVDLARDEMPHIILCDINMPEMTGDEVTHALSLDPLTHDIPVIYLTSLLERGDTEVLDGTFGGHWGVSKSASLAELLSVIARALQ
jgi:two-component system cell cycle response regulator DivK